MREIRSPLDGILSPFATERDAYSAAGLSPLLVADFTKPYFRKAGNTSTFSDTFTHSRAGNATMVDSDGLIKWAPHNLALNSAAPATQSITVVSGADYTVEITGSGSVALTGAGTGTVTAGNPVEITASTTTLTLTVTGTPSTMWAYRSDLGGMVNNPDRGDSYVPTTSAAIYQARRNHHTYNGTSWVNSGLLLETEARTNLLYGTNTLATQTYTTTAVPHTLSFTGTGTVTLSGSSTAGPLVGTGTGENNRVNLTFTPTAAGLTLTVTGTVTNAQLEIGSTPSSYMPNPGGVGTTATRFTESLQIAAADMPWPTPNVIGPELVTNGTFDADSVWTKTGAVTISGGEGVFTSAATSDGFRQDIMELGRTYEITFDVTSYTSGALRAYAGTGGIGTSRTAVGTYTEVLTCTGSPKTFSIIAIGTTTATIDNVSVREIDPLSVSLQMQGRITYADEGVEAQQTFARWYDDASNYITIDLDTDITDTGEVNFEQQDGTGGTGTVTADTYSPGILVPYNIASRNTSTAINGATDGTAGTEDTTPTALPDLSAKDFSLGYDYMGTIGLFRAWNKDIGDAGIEEASS